MKSKLVNRPISDAEFSPEARALLERRSKISARPGARITARTDGTTTVLSFTQEMVWLLSRLYEFTPAYNRCSALRISGELDRNALQRALSEIVSRHEILRSRIELDSGTPRVFVQPPTPVPLPVVHFSGDSDSDPRARTGNLLTAEAKRPFDLENGPWLRAGLISEDDQTQTLYISTHHIASDGWSDGVMFRELHALYAAFAAGEPSPLGPLATQYSDFAAWQRDRVESAEVVGDAAYWRERLKGAPATQRLPLDRPRLELPDLSAGEVKLGVRQTVVDALSAIGREQGSTLAMTMLAAWQLWQFRITEQADSIVGLSLAGRSIPQVDDLIGLFNTVVPIRVAIHREMTFRSLLSSVRAAVLEAQAHELVPVSALMESIPAEHGARHAEIARTLFNFRNMPGFEPSLPGLSVETVETFNGGAVADLQLEVIEGNDGLECALRFRTDVFDEATVARLLGHYATLLESISHAPEEQIGSLELLTQRERRQILVEFNGPVRQYPPPRYIDQLFGEQAEKTPAAIAVSSADGALTYQQLARCSDALARELQSRGVAFGNFVGVCMDRSLQMVVSLIAILKCGAAFVPLDTDYPPERLSYMLADTQPSLLLADAIGQSLLGTRGVDVFIVGTDWLEAADTTAPSLFVDRPDDAVACVLYTSGSTGLPKGVLSTHRGIVNNLRAVQEIYGLTPADCLLHQTSLGFDAAAWEIFWPLSIGARMYLARPGGQRDAEYIVRVIEEERIALIGFAPSMLKVMLRMPAFTGNPGIKRVMSYGEVLSPGLVSDLFAQMPSVEIYNLYGPAEASIVVTAWNCERVTERRSIPVGRPLANTEVYLLDSGLQPVPIGIEGELYIGGICVSNGYHNRPELTAERFLVHPFRLGSGDRIYRTGDIARFDRDGAIEYVGRRDHQLKIRGVRVELEEIEAALCQLAGVRECIVIATRDADDEPRLIAYVAADAGAGSAMDIRQALAGRLPPQFLPAQIVCLDELPHSPNGKIDRSQLPNSASIPQSSAPSASPPRTELETRLTAIWTKLLDVSDFAITDSFFNFGGHSLLAVRMLQQVADETGTLVSLRTFYEDPTIKTIVRVVSGVRAERPDDDTFPILRVRDGAAGSPILFYFNGQPAGGGRYAPALAEYLPAGQGFYVVPVPIFDAPLTVESLASRMLGFLRKEQQNGPYLLAGNCFGATLAFEIAQQLEAGGEKVDLVALVHPDARTPMHVGFRGIRRLTYHAGVPEEFHFAEFSGVFHYVGRAAIAIVGELKRSSWRERIDRLKQMTHWMADFASRNARKPIPRWFELGDREPREVDDLLRAQMQAECLPAATDNARVALARDEIAAHAEHMSAAWTAYSPRPYAGPVAIIWPVKGPANPPWAPRALWTRLTPRLHWQFVPGNHWTMLHKHFEHSARALALAIERARET